MSNQVQIVQICQMCQKLFSESENLRENSNERGKISSKMLLHQILKFSLRVKSGVRKEFGASNEL